MVLSETVSLGSCWQDVACPNLTDPSVQRSHGASFLTLPQQVRIEYGNEPLTVVPAVATILDCLSPAMIASPQAAHQTELREAQVHKLGAIDGLT